MKIVVAIDSFKGCLSSLQAGQCAALGVRSALPHCDVQVLEVADGGEGTAAAIAGALGMHERRVSVFNPLGRIMEASYMVSADGAVAAMDLAAASGLALIDAAERNPMLATTFGTGLMIKDAVALGCTHIIIGVGGSATVDGATGALQALGARFGVRHPEIRNAVAAGIEDVDATAAQALLKGAKITVLCDVATPLTGSAGAAATFGPQKGTTPQMVAELDRGLSLLAAVADRHNLPPVADMPGGGAGGGFAAGMCAFAGAEIVPGADYVLDTIGFERCIADADLVITGEGSMDAQTLMGKLPFAILRRCLRLHIPVLAVAGAVSNRPELYRAGFTAAACIQSGPATLTQAMNPATAAASITATTADYLRLLGGDRCHNLQTP